MFAPVGKKKVLLQIRQAKASGIADPLTALGLKTNSQSLETGALSVRSASASPTRTLERSRRLRTASEKSRTSNAGAISVAALIKLLRAKNEDGAVLRKILESTIRYRPERDSVLFKAFESKELSYTEFRRHLSTVLGLSFTDDEYLHVTHIFDISKIGFIDGVQFVVAFAKLNAIRRDREAKEVRKKQEEVQRNKDFEDERKRLEAEKKMEYDANFDYSEAARNSAMDKLALAAKKFDPCHPTAPNLDGLTSSSLKPAEFRDLLMRLFFLKLSRSETGALITKYGDKSGNVDLNYFLREFTRLGIEGRAHDAAAQRKLQELIDQRVEEEKLKKLTDAEKKYDLVIDYDFSALDEARAMEKLKDAARKYDRTLASAASLSGFECEFLKPSSFRDLLRRTFKLNFTNKEIGFVIRKYDKLDAGKVLCAPFIADFLRLGVDERHQRHLAQLQQQRKAEAEAEEELRKKRAAQEQSFTQKISFDYTGEDIQNALQRLTAVAVKYDKTRGAALDSFQCTALTPQEFREALAKTFNLWFSPKELGGLVCHFDKENKGAINCHHFLTTFFSMGANERFRRRTEQLAAQREAEKRAREENEQKNKMSTLTMQTAVMPIDFSFTDKDRDSAMTSLTHAAAKYDPNNSCAMKLTFFEASHLDAAQFREALRQTFAVKLTPKEIGAVLKHFSKDGDDTILDSSEFVKFFLQLGVAERHRLRKVMQDRQKADELEREADQKTRQEKEGARMEVQVAKDWTKEDVASVTEKLLNAAENYDRTSPGALALTAFEATTMTAGQFSQAIRVLFGVTLTSKELGYVISQYDAGGNDVGKLDCSKFIRKFLADGKTRRFEKHKQLLQAQREADKTAKKAEEEKQKTLWAGEKLDLDVSTFRAEDLNSALDKMAEAAERYDPAHTSAPSLEAFTGGAMKPALFRDALKKTFNVNLNPKELVAMLKEHPDANDDKCIDSKAFLVRFTKMGADIRARDRANRLFQQRQVDEEARRERERKKKIAEQRTILIIDKDFAESDYNTAIEKLRVASIKYDKTNPNCVSLDAFNAASFTPAQFRQVMKQTFNVNFTPKELAAMLAEYDDGDGNVNSSAVLVNFIKMGTEERSKIRQAQLDEKRKKEHLRRTEHERKMREVERKTAVKVKYDFTADEEDAAFEKLAIAAKRYDKSHRDCMGLEGFEAAEMNPTTFREMLKRTFGVLLSPGELGAVMQYFDTNKTGTIQSSEFLSHFIRVGMAERTKAKARRLKRQRKAAQDKQKEKDDRLAAQWALADAAMGSDYTEEQKLSALEKLTETAKKYDPANPGPMGLSAFNCSSMTPAVFREMLRRSFNLNLSEGEIAALVDMMKKEGKGEVKEVACSEFLLKFRQLGLSKRSEERLTQLEKSKQYTKQYDEEAAKKKKAADDKVEGTVDFNFTKDDFNSALEKIRGIVAKYDPNHVAAPSLKGFVGSSMRASEFNDMLLRTFRVHLTGKELGSLVKFYDSTDTGTVDNKEFLAHFSRLLRAEQQLRRKTRIEAERTVTGKQQDSISEKEKTQRKEEEDRMRFGPSDEKSFLRKIREAAQEYAINSMLLVEPLQALRGPALSPAAFRELFLRTFRIKLSYPEMGVLLSILDTNGLGIVDGPQFLNWFYKITRKEEKVMLGEAPDDLTMDILRLGGAGPGQGQAKAFTVLEPYNSPSPARTGRGLWKSADFSDGRNSGDESELLPPKSRQRGLPRGGKNKIKFTLRSSIPSDDTAEKKFLGMLEQQQWLLPATTSTVAPSEDYGGLKVPAAVALSDEYLTKAVSMSVAQEKEDQESDIPQAAGKLGDLAVIPEGKVGHGGTSSTKNQNKRQTGNTALAGATAPTPAVGSEFGPANVTRRDSSAMKREEDEEWKKDSKKFVFLTPLSPDKEGSPSMTMAPLTDAERSALFLPKSSSATRRPEKGLSTTTLTSNSLTRKLQKLGITQSLTRRQKPRSASGGRRGGEEGESSSPPPPPSLLTASLKPPSPYSGDVTALTTAAEEGSSGEAKGRHAPHSPLPLPRFDFFTAFSYDTLKKESFLQPESIDSLENVQNPNSKSNTGATTTGAPSKSMSGRDSSNQKQKKIKKQLRLRIQSSESSAGVGGGGGFLFPTLLSSAAPVINIAPTGWSSQSFGE